MDHYSLYIIIHCTPMSRPKMKSANNEHLFIGGSESHLSGCFQLFAPKFWKVAGTYKCYFVTL